MANKYVFLGLPPELLERIRIEAKRRHVSVGTYIRMILVQHHLVKVPPAYEGVLFFNAPKRRPIDDPVVLWTQEQERRAHERMRLFCEEGR